MYRVPYLRFAARFPICSFSSGVKCWYGDRLDVTVVTSHVTTTYNSAEKTFTNWLQTVKFAKVFSLESFPLYGTWLGLRTPLLVSSPDVHSTILTNKKFALKVHVGAKVFAVR